MPTATSETFRYQIELNDGRVFEIETDHEITSQTEIDALVWQQLELEQAPGQAPSSPSRPDSQDVAPDSPASNVSLGDLGRQVLGGARDAAQGVLDAPTGILNTITEFMSPDPPGPAGTRRRLVPEVKTPITLPNVPEGSTAEERGTRLLAGLATALLPIGSVASRVIRGSQGLNKASSIVLRGLTGTDNIKNLDQTRLVRLLEDLEDIEVAQPGILQADGELKDIFDAARQRLDDLGSSLTHSETATPPRSGSRPDSSSGVPTEAQRTSAVDQLIERTMRSESAGTAIQPLGESARRLARVFDLPFRPEDFTKMSMEQATAARQRLMSRLPDVDIEQQGGPFLELLKAIEAQIARLQ